LKELLKNLRSNLNEENSERIAKAMNNVKLLAERTEEQAKIRRDHSSSNKVDMVKSVPGLAIEMNKQNPFDDSTSTYEAFPDFDGKVFKKLDCTKYLK